MGTHKQIKETQMTRTAFQLMEDFQLFSPSFRTSLRMSAVNSPYGIYYAHQMQDFCTRKSTENGDGRKEGWSSGIGKVQGRKGKRDGRGKGEGKG